MLSRRCGINTNCLPPSPLASLLTHMTLILAHTTLILAQMTRPDSGSHDPILSHTTLILADRTRPDSGSRDHESGFNSVPYYLTA